MNALTSLLPLPWIAATMLLSLRVGTMLLSTPVFSAADLPVRVRLMVVLGLSATLCAGLEAGRDSAAGASLLAVASQPGALIRAALTEIALGAVMSLAIHAGFAAFSMAGSLLDVQLGFGLSQVFDPATNSVSPVLTTAMNRIAVLMFFLVDGHHALLRAVVFSLHRVPLGASWDAGATMAPMIEHVVSLFALTLALAVPIVFCLLLCELALGFLARNLPQMNMLTMGIPVKIVIGLAALCIWFAGIGPAMDRVYRGIFEALDASLSAAGPRAGLATGGL
jgi:flagellar biosynthetic protein FliR